ncbi:class I SAM-dependent methyltransferase [Salipaludibacillus agaradhaerens]|uniref:class I SAM-dependent methyltransferase n=1 Tax=Salipaludibacillus agaradhaerens TaxID=76935 RepID=UPI0021513FA3|nr:class I SAM-dependent methyltransferase [Salipaludibacillus agaradhaerens]MCR6105593.1 class I SAM-dependent methyltransferase [Salipaludibacillus agaradhaerens]MCR6117630.1 class I SAM-dependent methyltransferase [Salipaludibacillus agaradhaerens]UJW56816.1 class I SAM-dependent methyltransferase [Bacillus sp. A116_S68]
MEKNNDFYDQVYKAGGHKRMYAKHYRHSPYLQLWEKSLHILKGMKDPKIIDIGCGVGQYANLLFDHELLDYKGIDFSDEAIRLAKMTNNLYEDKFEVDDAYTSSIYDDDYNTAILFEVLEHLQEDLRVLSKIKVGTHVILSVPNFDTVSHVRYFTGEEDVNKRYGELIAFQEIYTFPLAGSSKLFLAHGIKN